MRIVVLIKQVPDTYGTRVLDVETGITDRRAGDAVLDEIGERALEVALAYADTHPDTEVIALTMGPRSAETALRKALSMGASGAVHVVDDTLAGSDFATTAEVLAAAVARTGYDLVIAGDRSTDGSGGVMPTMIAEHLGVPHATALSSIILSDGRITGVRSTDIASLGITTPLPAVISITEALPDARFPSLKGIMSAKKKPLETFSVAELGVDVNDETRAHSIVIAVTERPARTSGVKVVDDGDAAEQLVDFLAGAKLL